RRTAGLLGGGRRRGPGRRHHRRPLSVLRFRRSSFLPRVPPSLRAAVTSTGPAAKDATDAVVGLPNARMVTLRERCAVAQNGAPDCQAAAAAACRGKGFQTGKSLDTQSEHKCPAQVLLKGRAPSDAERPTELFVTRAVCQ